MVSRQAGHGQEGRQGQAQGSTSPRRDTTCVSWIPPSVLYTALPLQRRLARMGGNTIPKEKNLQVRYGGYVRKWQIETTRGGTAVAMHMQAHNVGATGARGCRFHHSQGGARSGGAIERRRSCVDDPATDEPCRAGREKFDWSKKNLLRQEKEYQQTGEGGVQRTPRKHYQCSVRACP